MAPPKRGKSPKGKKGGKGAPMKPGDRPAAGHVAGPKAPIMPPKSGPKFR